MKLCSLNDDTWKVEAYKILDQLEPVQSTVRLTHPHWRAALFFMNELCTLDLVDVHGPNLIVCSSF